MGVLPMGGIGVGGLGGPGPVGPGGGAVPPGAAANFPALGVGGMVPTPLAGGGAVAAFQSILPTVAGNADEANAIGNIQQALQAALAAPNGNQLADALLCGGHVVFPNLSFQNAMAPPPPGGPLPGVANANALAGRPVVNLGNVAQRTSSHYRSPLFFNNPNQHGIDITITAGAPAGPRQAHLLFGASAYNNPAAPLFIQLENAGVGGGILQHAFDFVTYLVTGNQVGPYGRCGYNDGHAISVP